MLENVLFLLFSGVGALLVVADAEQRKNAPWLAPNRREEHRAVESGGH
jgi:hypothetical protein